MNIFVLDTNPRVAAQYLCDKHVTKMIVESGQMLMSWYYQKNGIVTHKQYKQEHSKVIELTSGFPRETPYGLGFPHHPCTQWLLESDANVLWLIDHLDEMLKEFTLRFKKDHQVSKVFAWFTQRVLGSLSKDSAITPFALAMPDKYKIYDSSLQTYDVVESYRRFYYGEKKEFATWKNKPIPQWFQMEKSRAELLSIFRGMVRA